LNSIKLGFQEFESSIFFGHGKLISKMKSLFHAAELYLNTSEVVMFKSSGWAVEHARTGGSHGHQRLPTDMANSPRPS